MSERTSYAEGVPSWVDLMTSDPTGARAFYQGLFGWEYDINPDPQTGNYTMAMLRGKLVAGVAGQPMPDLPTAWTTYIATSDVEKSVARVREHGGTVQVEPLQVMDAGWMASAADPTGAVFGMWQAGTHTGAQLVNEPGTLSWNELETTDLDAATRFYSGVFGVTWEDVDTGQGPRYRTMHVGGQMAGGAMQMTDDWPEGVPPHWTPYFGVQDTDASAARATELGGMVHVPPTDSPYGRWSAITDPQGAGLTIISVAAAEGGAAQA